MSDNVIAAIAGAMTAGVSQYRRGWVVMLQTVTTGFLSAYFLAANLVLVAEKYLGVTLLYSAAYFLCALYGSAIYDRARRLITTWSPNARY